MLGGGTCEARWDRVFVDGSESWLQMAATLLVKTQQKCPLWGDSLWRYRLLLLFVVCPKLICSLLSSLSPHQEINKSFSLEAAVNYHSVPAALLKSSTKYSARIRALVDTSRSSHYSGYSSPWSETVHWTTRSGDPEIWPLTPNLWTFISDLSGIQLTVEPDSQGLCWDM